MLSRSQPFPSAVAFATLLFRMSLQCPGPGYMPGFVVYLPLRSPQKGVAIVAVVQQDKFDEIKDKVLAEAGVKAFRMETLRNAGADF